MTVQASLNNSSTGLEFILCVEGMGWPSDETDLSQSWQGDVFVTSDINGDLATVLGCTVHEGLELPTSIGDSFDPVSLRYSSGGADFEVVDLDNYIKGVFVPNKQTITNSIENFGTLLADLDFSSTTVDIQKDNPGGSTVSFNTGDIVWIGGREAVSLGTKSTITGGHRYTGSTRAYLGTVRGSHDPRSAATGQFSFKTDTSVYPDNPYWHDRRVALFMHIPGEARANCLRVYSGRLRSFRRRNHGNFFSIGTKAEDFTGYYKVHQPVRGHRVKSQNLVIAQNGSEVTPSDYNRYLEGGFLEGREHLYQTQGAASPDATKRYIVISRDEAIDDYDKNGIVFAYAYRTVTGGTKGALDAYSSNPNAPQAESITFDHNDSYLATSNDMMNTVLSINGVLVRALHKYPGATDSSAGLPAEHIICEFSTAEFGGEFYEPFEIGAEVRFMLDNFHPDPRLNPFTVNKQISRNIVDVALCFMTSHSNEFALFDSNGAVSQTTITATSSPGWDTNQWAGYALHCVEGANKGEARVITSNTASAVTVDTAFSNGPASGDQYQVRNTIYDVLPHGWGMHLHNSRIDIDNWETVRDTFCHGMEVGRFAIGDQDAATNIWQLIVENILEPYGLSTYVDRSSGKISVRFVGAEYQSGLIESYESVTDSNLIPGSIENMDLMPRIPMKGIDLKTRNSSTVAIRAIYEDRSAQFVPPDSASWFVNSDGPGSYRTITGYQFSDVADASIGSDANTIPIRLKEVEESNHLTEHGVMTISAMFNSWQDAGPLAALLYERVRRLSVPDPETTLILDLSFLPKIQAGALVSVTSTALGAWDPHTGQDNWSSKVCRVLTSQANFLDGTLVCRVQVLSVVQGALIAPAVVVTSKGTSPNHFINTNENFVDNPSEYDKQDWTGLLVNDRIELRDVNGAYKGGPYTIASFGFNEASTSAAALSNQINVNESITPTIATGDYLTFSPWVSGSNTSNQEGFSAYGDATNENLGASDEAKRYI